MSETPEQQIERLTRELMDARLQATRAEREIGYQCDGWVAEMVDNERLEGYVRTLCREVDELRRERDEARELLRECGNLLCAHHEASLTTWIGECPVCSYEHTQDYPQNIFGRIERILK